MEDIIEQEATEEQLAQQPIEQPDQPQETVPAQEPEEAPPAPQPRTYTQDEVDAIVSKRLSRKETSIRKEYDRQYGGLMDVLRAGTGKDSVDEIADSYRQFYQGQGVSVPQRSAFTDDDIRVLAQAEAQEIISGGDSEVAEEVDRLAGIGSGKMTAREKELFRVLAEHRHAAEQSREMAQIGVTKDVYESRAFQDFAGKFAPNIPIREIYDLYAKTLPRKEIKPMGSMVSTATKDNGVKDFYSYDEAVKFKKSDFDKNPELYKAVQRSMTKW